MYIIYQNMKCLTNIHLFLIIILSFDLFLFSSSSIIVDWHVRFQASSRLRYASFHLKHLKAFAKENDFRDFIHLTHTRNYFMIRKVFTIHSCKDRLTFCKWQLVLIYSLTLDQIKWYKNPHNLDKTNTREYLLEIFCKWRRKNFIQASSF